MKSIILSIIIVIKFTNSLGEILIPYAMAIKHDYRTTSQQKLGYKNYVYTRSNETYENKKIAEDLQKNLFPICISFTDIQRQFINQPIKQETYLFKIADLNITRDEQTYEYSLAQYNPDILPQLQNEINFSIRLKKLIPNHTKEFLSCYVDFFDHYYVVIQQKVKGNQILEKKPNQIEYYFKDIPEIVTQKAFIEMFKALDILNQNNIMLRTIEPSNILTNIKYAEMNISGLNQMYFLFKDFTLAVKNRVESRFQGNPYYAHPETSFLHKRKLVYNEDVYQLSLSILHIYAQVQQSQDIQNMNQDPLFQNTQFDTILQEEVQKEQIIPDEQRQQFAQELVQNLKKNIFDYFKFTNKSQTILDEELYKIQNTPLTDKKKVKLLKSVCNQNFYCILYYAIQVDIQQIPDAKLIHEALETNLLQIIQQRLIKFNQYKEKYGRRHIHSRRSQNTFQISTYEQKQILRLNSRLYGFRGCT